MSPKPKEQTPVSVARYTRFLKAFPGRRMGVVGDWMLDRYVWGTATRLSPEAAVPVVDYVEESSVLGGAGNVAANLAALGAKVVPFGVAGADDNAAVLRAKVRECGMRDTGILTDAARKTTVKTRVIARHQQVVRVDRETRSPLRSEIEEQLVRRIIAELRNLDALVLSDYDKGVVTEGLPERVLSACRKLDIPAFVKPKWSRLPTYPGATIIVLNRQEAGFLVTRPLEDDAEVEEAGRALLAHFGCPAVIITRGEKGMSIVEHDAPHAVHIAATSRELPIGRLGQLRVHHAGFGRQVFDVTGAGDTVLATLALGVAAGVTLAAAARIANCAAGVVVGKLGTATVTPAELLAALRELT